MSNMNLSAVKRQATMALDRMRHATTTQEAADEAADAYLLTKAMIAHIEEMHKEAKKVLTEIMEESHTHTISTLTGAIVTYVPPTVSSSYDTKALDIVCDHNPDVAAAIRQYRKESYRRGYVRVK